MSVWFDLFLLNTKPNQTNIIGFFNRFDVIFRFDLNTPECKYSTPVHQIFRKSEKVKVGI